MMRKVFRVLGTVLILIGVAIVAILCELARYVLPAIALLIALALAVSTIERGLRPQPPVPARAGR